MPPRAHPRRSGLSEREPPACRKAAGAARGWGIMVPLLLLLLLLLLLPPLLLRPRLWPQLRWLTADLTFAVRALRCKRALRARALAAAAADPEGPEGGCSLAWRLAQLAQERPAHTFLVHGARRFSYAEAERQSNRAARAFLRARSCGAGVGAPDAAAGSGAARAVREGDGAAPLAPGATVALLLPACPEFLWLWFGLAKAGLCTAFVPTALRRGPLLHCLRSCAARALVLAPGKAGAPTDGGGASAERACREGDQSGGTRMEAELAPWDSERLGRDTILNVCLEMQLGLWFPKNF